MNRPWDKVVTTDKTIRQEKVRKTLLPIAVLVFGFGLFLVFSSTKLGMAKSESAIRHNGGSMETKKYYLIMQESISSYRTGGALITLLAGGTLLICLFSEMKK